MSDYEHGKVYSGRVIAVGVVDIRGGKPTLPLSIAGERGVIKSTLFLTQDDARDNFPSSFESAKRLAEYLGCRDFRPPFTGMVSDKPVTFKADVQPNPYGGYYYEAKNVKAPAGMVAKNPASKAVLDSLFGTPAGTVPMAPDTGHDNPASPPDASNAAGDDEIPF